MKIEEHLGNSDDPMRTQSYVSQSETEDPHFLVEQEKVKSLSNEFTSKNLTGHDYSFLQSLQNNKETQKDPSKETQKGASKDISMDYIGGENQTPENDKRIGDGSLDKIHE